MYRVTRRDVDAFLGKVQEDLRAIVEGRMDSKAGWALLDHRIDVFREVLGVRKQKG